MSRPKNRRFSFDARLDWLQLTAFTNKIKMEQFAEHFFHLKRKLNEADLEASEVAFSQGKHGGVYKGHRVGPLMFVTNYATEHRMIIGSGRNAQLLLNYARENQMVANASRIDARLEIEYEEPQPKRGDIARAHIMANDEVKKRTTRTQVELYNAKHADTGIRSGARTSDILWNFYDSGFYHQQRTDSMCWAMEVRLHKNPAKQFWGDCLSSDSVPKLCLDMVTTRFEKLGIREPGLSDAGNYKIASTRPIAPMERKLLYVDTTLCNMIKTLRDAGFDGDVKSIFRKHGLIDENDIFLNSK